MSGRLREIPYNYTSFSDREIVLRLLGGPDAGGRRVLTIGLPRELPAVSEQRTGSGTPIDTTTASGPRSMLR